MIYIIVFLISIFLLFFATKITNNRIVRLLFVFLSVLVPCFFAAIRDLNIGTDVRVYVEPLFTVSLISNSFFTFFNSIYGINDLGYIVVTFLCGKMSNNILYLLLTNQFLIMIPVLIALIKKYGYKKELLFGWTLFLLVMYNQSLNMVRQSIAISFSILAISNINNKKSLLYIIFSIIAISFHKSAIVLLPILIMYRLLYSDDIKEKNKFLIKFVIVTLLILGLLFLPQLLLFFKDIGLISSTKYNLYIIQYSRDGFDFPLIRTLLYLLTIIFIIYNKDNDNSKEYKIILLFGVISIILLEYCCRIMYAERISYYFFYPLVILYMPLLLQNSKNKLFNSFTFQIIIVAFWIYWVLYLNYDSTLPFVVR